MLTDHYKNAGHAHGKVLVGGVKSIVGMKLDSQLWGGVMQSLHCAFEFFKHYRADHRVAIMAELCPVLNSRSGYDVMKASCREMRAAEGNWLTTSLYVNSTMKVALCAINGLAKQSWNEQSTSFYVIG